MLDNKNVLILNKPNATLNNKNVVLTLNNKNVVVNKFEVRVSFLKLSFIY
jgi:hypothetical protein